MKITVLKKNDDGDGYCLNVPFAAVALLFTVLLSLIPVVFAYGSLSERVNNLQDNYEFSTPNTFDKIDNIEDRLIVLEKIAAGTEVSLFTIQSDIGEIKFDVKELRKEMIK